MSFVHPALLDDLSDWRELATELKLSQGNDQLYRETFEKPKDGTQTSIGDYKDGKFEQLRHAYGRCKTLGYLVSGGFAKCALVQEGRHIDALYWIGAEDPESETFTGELTFTDATQKTLTLDDVPPVAYSEGMRMASAIYAARVIVKEGDQEEEAE